VEKKAHSSSISWFMVEMAKIVVTENVKTILLKLF
jgi:hypothetical protein